MKAREEFYGRMIWIVDGCKNEFDKYYFEMSIHDGFTGNKYIKNLRWMGRSKLFERWMSATKPVYLDFGTEILWHILKYDCLSKEGLIQAYEKKKFVEYFSGQPCIQEGINNFV